ncbi:hypothetical protein CSQ89_18395 [Chitinimonas sp. BJB300]|nr:hypothetical protein CSQ89_18395 [Chitinimonas sp. BJB300]
MCKAIAAKAARARKEAACGAQPKASTERVRAWQSESLLPGWRELHVEKRRPGEQEKRGMNERRDRAQRKVSQPGIDTGRGQRTRQAMVAAP